MRESESHPSPTRRIRLSPADDSGVRRPLKARALRSPGSPRGAAAAATRPRSGGVREFWRSQCGLCGTRRHHRRRACLEDIMIVCI